MNIIFLQDVYVEALGVNDCNLREYGTAEMLLSKLQNRDMMEIVNSTRAFVRLLNTHVKENYPLSLPDCLSNKAQRIDVDNYIADIQEHIAVSSLTHPNTNLKASATMDGTVFIWARKNNCTLKLTDSIAKEVGEVLGVEYMLQCPNWT